MIKIEDVLNRPITGDTVDVLPQLPEKSVHCIVTSPPYWAVRDYKIEPTPWPEVIFSLFGFDMTIPAMVCQLGQEKSPMEFIGHMVHVFRLAHRVLRDDGTIWMNMGDCYNSKSGGYKMSAKHHGNHNYISEGTGQARLKINRNLKTMKLKKKDMIGIPWMLAFALRDDGWYLRQDIIWNKPNPMPESTSDRCTKAHEYIFLLSKKPKYFYDSYAISTEVKDSTVKRMMQDIESQAGSVRAAGGLKHNGPMKAYIRRPNNVAEGTKGYGDRKVRTEEEKTYGINGKGFQGHSGNFDADGNLIGNGRANKKSVWTVTTRGTKVNHFATFPEELPRDAIKAGTSEHGVCSTCGAPYYRQTKKKLVPGKDAKVNFTSDDRDDEGKSVNDQGSRRQKTGHKNGHHYEYSDSKFVPGCSCNASIVPAIVMDIFGGYNTTMLIARKLQRNAISIDRNPDYVSMSGDRLADELTGFQIPLIH